MASGKPTFEVGVEAGEATVVGGKRVDAGGSKDFDEGFARAGRGPKTVRVKTVTQKFARARS